jgi:hypothetical protein
MIRTLALRPVARIALVAGLALALTGLAIALAPSAHNHDSASAASRANRSTFHDAMRQLWEDHIVWTRMAVVSIVDDRPDQSFAVERLLRNQDDIGDAIKPFYGEAAGDALTALLREHIVGAADLLGGSEDRRRVRGRPRGVVRQRCRDRSLSGRRESSQLGSRGDAGHDGRPPRPDPRRGGCPATGRLRR